MAKIPIQQLLLSLCLAATSVAEGASLLREASASAAEKNVVQVDDQVVNANTIGVRGALEVSSLQQAVQRRTSPVRHLMGNKDDKKKDKDDDDNQSENGNPSFNSGFTSASGLTEPPPGICASFSEWSNQNKAESSLTDPECKTNSCDGGCCRIFSEWLICDTTNTYDHLKCVCNQNTWIQAPPPTSPPVATAPTTTPQPVASTTTTSTPPPAVVTSTAPPAGDREDVPADNGNNPLVSPVADWEQCLEGSFYHETASEEQKCFKAEDCTVPDECCIANFCICGKSGNVQDSCVPSRFQEDVSVESETGPKTSAPAPTGNVVPAPPTVGSVAVPTADGSVVAPPTPGTNAAPTQGSNASPTVSKVAVPTVVNDAPPTVGSVPVPTADSNVVAPTLVTSIAPTQGTPAPATKTPVTSPPVTSAPVTSPPTSKAPIVAPTPPPQPTLPPETRNPASLEPWEQCMNGSFYHDTVSVGKCFKADDCTLPDECCVRNFCICARNTNLQGECVPKNPNAEASTSEEALTVSSPTKAPVASATPAPVAPVSAAAPMAPVTAATPVPATSAPVSKLPTTTAPIPVATLAPVSKLPTTAPMPVVTSAPVAPTPRVIPPTTAGLTQPWEQCAAGSSYHATAGAGSQKCFFAEDCELEAECCIRSFCICAKAENLSGECVPSRNGGT